MAIKAAKQPKRIDLSEYAEEAIPFDAVIRKIGKVAPIAIRKPKPKPARNPK